MSMARPGKDGGLDCQSARDEVAEDLPLLVLNVPVFGNGKLTVEGWGFYLQRRKLEVDVWLDGIARFLANRHA